MNYPPDKKWICVDMIYPGMEAAASFDAWIAVSGQLKAWQLNHFPLIVGLWNVLIIAVPWWAGRFLLSLAERGQWRWNNWRFYAAFLIWFLFIPNAAYLIADVRHLDGFCPTANNYYRICDQGAWLIPMFFVLGALGWLALVWLVGQVATATRLAWGRLAAWLFEIIMLPLIALGVLLGMLDRWNSWQVISDLPGVLTSASSFIADPWRLRNWLVYSVVFYLLYFGGHAILRRGSNRG